MRWLKKNFPKIKLFIKNLNYIRENLKFVKKELNVDKIVFNSFGGADINFLIKKGKKTVAMMRLAIVDDDTNQFIINRFNKKRRISTEINAYKKCHKDGLTPELLLSSENFTVCSYIDGLSAEKMLKQNKVEVYEFYETILKLYVKIHEKDVVHLDATLKNIFYDNDSKSFKVVDFEYYALKDISLKKQKLYDYLRFTEYILRKHKGDLSRFIEILDKVVLNSYNNIDLTSLKPLLNRLNEIDEIKSYLNNKNIKF